jgi:hypothetical protein
MIVGVVRQEHVDALRAVAEQLRSQGLVAQSAQVTAVLAQIARSPDQLPASVAAEVLGVGEEVLAGWVRSGIVTGTIGHSGCVTVALDALEPALAMRAALPDVSVDDVSDAEIGAEIDAVRAARRQRSTLGG